jgi:hypothetical protein
MFRRFFSMVETGAPPAGVPESAAPTCGFSFGMAFSGGRAARKMAELQDEF